MAVRISSGRSFLAVPRSNAITDSSEPPMLEPSLSPLQHNIGEGLRRVICVQLPWPNARSEEAYCGAPRRHPVGGAVQARQVLYARQQIHIRLGGVLGRYWSDPWH